MKKFISVLLIFAISIIFILPQKEVKGEAYKETDADYFLKIDAGNKLFDLSEMMYGIFLEDINAACDGGLSAEMVENRSFEYGNKYGCSPDYKWEKVESLSYEIKDGSDDFTALNDNNTHYMVMSNDSGSPAGIANTGFLDGMSVKEGKKYIFSVYAKGLYGYTGGLNVDIMVDGVPAASGKIADVTDEWKKYELELIADTTSSSTNSYKSVKLQITIDNGSCAVDMVSLMPADNTAGFRTDLVNRLKEMKPGFFRFPGGCVTEGTSTPDDAYNWKQSVGCDEMGEPLLFNNVYGDKAVRRIGENNDWNYYMSYDLGFYEYFVLCEYIDTLAVPVLNAGLGCDVRGATTAHTGEELQKDIQTALDLVEFCRGDENTKWGAVRISMGHREPFEIKYIGIGNEQNNEFYFKNYSEFVKAFAEAAGKNPDMYGDIQLIMSPIIGEGTGWYKSNVQRSYKYAYEWLEDNPSYTKEQWAAVYDHHNYNSPEWFFKNCDYFAPSNYSRTDCNGNYGGMFDVFLGEYAAHVEDNPNALLEALAEAACMTSLEHNGDIVKMSCYAPLFCSVNKVNWKWNMIYFDNDEVLNTTNYYAQKMFMNNTGTKQLYSRLIGAEKSEQTYFGGLAEHDLNLKNIIITDENTGRKYGMDDMPELLENYTFEADFCGEDKEASIDFAVKDADNYFTWNIGHDGKTSLSQTVKGRKSEISWTVFDFEAEKDKVYHLKIDVDKKQIKCFIDGKEYAFYNSGDTDAWAYQSVNLDKNGDIIIKLVNVADEDKTFEVSIDNAKNMKSTAAVYCLSGDDINDKNEMGASDNMETEYQTVSGIQDKFNYTVPKYSITILRIPTDDKEITTELPDNKITEPNVPSGNNSGNTEADKHADITKEDAVKQGDTFTNGYYKYKVVKSGKKFAASITGVTKKARKRTNIKIPAGVKYKNNFLEVTSIKAKAFKNLKKLKKVTIGKNIKSVGRNAFPGTKKKITVCVPKKNFGKVKKMLKKCGLKSKTTVYKKI